MPKNETHCYSYFSICSEGDIVEGAGFVAAPDSDFSPEEISERLGLEAYRAWRLGDPRPGSDRNYAFSNWQGCYQESPGINAGEQCRKITEILLDKKDILKELKKEYNIYYTISVVSNIYDAEQPIMYFEKDVIKFCSETETEIDIDQYIYTNDDEE